MAAVDQYSLTQALDRQLTGRTGVLGIVNLNTGIGIRILLSGTRASETVELTQPGGTLEVPETGLTSIHVEAYNLATGAPSYPASILLLDSELGVRISTPQTFAGSAGGGATIAVETVGLSGALLQQVVTVGLVAVQVPAAALANRRAIIIQALASNTKTVYLGSATVTADETATGGIQLVPGASISVELGGAILSAISTAAGQHLAIIEGA